MKNPYKNMIVYTITHDLLNNIRNEVDSWVNDGFDMFSGRLDKLAARDPEHSSYHALGFIAPAPESADLVVEINPHTFVMCVQRNSKMLPAKVLNEHTGKRIALAAEKIGRELTVAEFAQIKDETEAELLKTAFIRRERIYVLIALIGINRPPILIICTANSKLADEISELLRLGLSTAPISLQPWMPERDVIALLRDVALGNNKHPTGQLFADDSCTLKGTSDKRVIRVKNRDIAGEDIQELLASGYEPTALAMQYSDEHADEGFNAALSFQLDEKLAFRRVTVSKRVYPDYDYDRAAAVGEEFTANILMTLAVFLDMFSCIEDYLKDDDDEI